MWLLDYDNGEEYDDKMHYTIGVFEHYDKACKFCVDLGYNETNIKGYYKKSKHHWDWDYESISINKIELNVELNYDGETVKKDKAGNDQSSNT